MLKLTWLKCQVFLGVFYHILTFLYIVLGMYIQIMHG